MSTPSRNPRGPLLKPEYIEERLLELGVQRDNLVKQRRIEQKKESMLQNKKIKLPKSPEEILIRKEIRSLQVARARRKKALEKKE